MSIMIEFICCGDRKIVHNLYDCNMIGNYEMIHSILNKCQAYGDMMEDHVYKPGKSKTNDDTWYCTFCDLIGRGICGDPRFGDVWFRNNFYASTFIWPAFDDRPKNNISKSIFYSLKSGYTYDKPVYSNKVGNNLYDTKEHLENWKYFVFNNKLPLFINICLIISQNNNSKNYIPWLVDKQYTDNEIFEKLNISKDEIELINNTLEKYNRNSPWFKRYMIGKNTDK